MIGTLSTLKMVGLILVNVTVLTTVVILTLQYVIKE